LTVNCSGSPANTPSRVVVMTLVLPCISCCARMILPPKRRADRLVAQADAQDRQLAGEVLDRLDRNTGLGGEHGPGEITSRSGARAAISAT
jgi:hypothetical protein